MDDAASQKSIYGFVAILALFATGRAMVFFRCTALYWIALLSFGCDAMESIPEPEPRTGRGATLSVRTLGETSAAEISSNFVTIGLPVAVRYGVTTYKIVYETIDATGSVTTASGAILVPAGVPTPMSLLSLEHGTVVRRDAAPSASESARLIGVAFATSGYMVAMADLLGLGDSPGLHPYVHAATSSTAVVDMLRATTDFAASEGLDLSGKLFLAGYSQGGYTAMAAHRALEADHADEFRVTASAPMAGPYDLSGVMAMEMTGPRPHPSPYYLPYTLLAYNAVYRLYPDASAFFRSPYDKRLPPLFDGMHSGGQINAQMPRVPGHILLPSIVAEFAADADHPFRRVLQENDVYDWAPRAPIRLYHCAADQLVPFENSRVALRHLLARGADVQLIDPLPVGDHLACAPLSFILAKTWFDSF